MGLPHLESWQKSSSKETLRGSLKGGEVKKPNSKDGKITEEGKG